MDDIISYNMATNALRKAHTHEDEGELKTIFFFISHLVLNGVQPIQIRLPFDAKIIGVHATANIPGDTDSLIQLEKINDINLTTWDSLLSPELLLPATEISCEISGLSIDCKKGEYLRINMIEVGSNLHHLNIEVSMLASK